MIDGFQPRMSRQLILKSAFLVIDDIPNICEKYFGDLSIRAEYFDGGLTERLSTAQIIDFSAHSRTVIGDHLDIIAVEHPL